MDPVTMTLMAANMGGGLLGLHKNKPKTISPEWLKKHFGAGAVNEEMIQLFNHMLASPYGQQMMASTAQQGQDFQSQMSRNIASAGMGPSGGAESGASIFSGAAAGGATNALQRQGKADIMEAAMPVAQQMVAQRMQIAAGSQQSALDVSNARPSGWGQFGNMLATGANAAMMASPGASGQKAPTNVAGAVQPQITGMGTPQNAASMSGISGVMGGSRKLGRLNRGMGMSRLATASGEEQNGYKF